MLKYSIEDQKRFWSKIDATEYADNCWKWKACCDKKGYGHFTHKRISKFAHRVAWEMTYDEIPDNLCVLHKCDNPSCCNPAHLFLGTLADNVHDMVSKGRQAKGEKHGRTIKLPQKRKPRITPVTFYLGDSPLREVRAERLTQIANKINIKTRSEMLQMIADGELEVRHKR